MFNLFSLGIVMAMSVFDILLYARSKIYFKVFEYFKLRLLWLIVQLYLHCILLLNIININLK